jgi:hypothetical protein
VRHDAAIEGVGVRIEPSAIYELDEFWPEMQAGVRAGNDVARERGIRLLCTSLFIPSTKGLPVDTSPDLARTRLAEFVLSQLVSWAEPIPPLHKDWLTSDVIALARGIHATSSFDGLPALHDALLEAGCDDPLVMEHLRTCPDHSPSCWVVEMILAGSTARASG